MKEKDRLGQSVISTLVRLEEWFSSIQAVESSSILERISARASLAPGSEFMETIGEAFSEGASGIERSLLSKSVQEALLYGVSFHADSGYAHFKAQLVKYLARYGKAVLIRRFLSLFFFNYVWFEVGEIFREAAANSEMFEKDIESVDRVCQAAVTSVWKVFEQTGRRIDAGSAAEIIRRIEQQIRGD